MRLPVLLIALAALVAGCGYKTPLKLPPPSKPPEKAAAQKPAPADDDRKAADEP